MRIISLTLTVGLVFAGQAFAANISGEPTFSMSPDLATVQNNCIVRLSDDVSSLDVEGRAHSLLKRANALNAANGRANASLKFLYKHSIKGFTLNLPCDKARAAFGDDADVKSFEPDGIMTATKGKPGGGTTPPPPSQQIPWSVARVGGPVDGTGHTAWIIDTGIDTANADLNVNTTHAFSVFKDRRNAGFNDKNGHGTHVSGIIAAINNNIDVVGVAAGAMVVPVKVLDANGSGTTSGVIAGVDHVASLASPGDCANMSLGGGVNQALDAAVVAASSNGVFFTIAAGNDGGDANNHSPARANGPYVFTISAIDINDNMPSWSNFANPPIDYAAPGVNILSLKLGGGTTTMSGTSMAAPAACGVLLMTNGMPPNSSGVAGNDPDGEPDPIIIF
jgi:subtilisin family serine protease